MSDPSQSLGEEVTARELLDRGAERIRTQLSDQPLVQAHMLSTIGNVYRSLFLFREAADLLEEALEIRERELGPDAVEVGETLLELSRVRPRLGDGATAKAELERTREIYRSAEGTASVGYGRASNNLATFYRAAGDVETAEALVREAIRAFEEHPDQQPPLPEIDGQLPRTVAARSRIVLANTLRGRGDYEAAEEQYIQSLAVRQETLHRDRARARALER